MRRKRCHKVLISIAALAVVVVAIFGPLVWWKFFQSAPQELANDLERFKYGSLDGEVFAGIPYPLFMVLPRVFPDLVEKYATQGFGKKGDGKEPAGQGGYAAFG